MAMRQARNVDRCYSLQMSIYRPTVGMFTQFQHGGHKPQV